MVAARVVRLADRAQLVPQNPRDRADARHVVLVADALGEQTVADLPGEDARVLLLQLADVCDDFGRRDARLRAADRSRQNRARLVIARQYLGHAAVADAQLPRYITRTDPQARQLHDTQPRLVWQGPPVYEDSPQLVHLAVLLRLGLCNGREPRIISMPTVKSPVAICAMTARRMQRIPIAKALSQFAMSE